MKRRLLILLSSLLVALPAAAQSDCAANLRCGQVPWQLPLMPVLVSPTPLATTAAEVVQATDQSAYINPTPSYCDEATPGAQSTTYRAAVASTRPSAWWPMDETSGTVMNDAIGTRNGTYSGATLNAYTLAGGAAPGFDGVNDKAYVSGVASIFNAYNFTISLWMRVATNWAGSGTVAYFGSGTDVISITRSGGNIVLTSGGAQASASASANGSSWVHVAAVVNRAVMGGQSGRLYINGQSAATANMAPGTFTASTLFLASSGTASYYAGGIAQVAIYNRALNPSEIAILANASPSGTPAATNDARCGPPAIPTSPVDVSGIVDTMATLQTLPVNQVGIANPQAGFDLYSGTATFFSYVLGIQSINLGILTPVITFIFWAFFSFIGIKVAFILLPIIAALVGVTRRIIQLVLDFLPF